MTAGRKAPTAAEQTIGELWKRLQRGEDLSLSPEQWEIWVGAETLLSMEQQLSQSVSASDSDDYLLLAIDVLKQCRLPTTGSGAPLKNPGWEEEIECLLQWARECKTKYRRDGDTAKDAERKTISDLPKHELLRRLPERFRTAIVDAVTRDLKDRRRIPR